MLAHILILAGLACYAQEPADTVLSRLNDQISECLNAMRLDEARRLIGQALAMEGVEKSEYYVTMRHHEGTLCQLSGDFACFKQNRLELLQRLPVDYFPEMSISVPMDLGVIYRREGQNDSALFYYDQALQAATAGHDVEWLAAINLNVGILHFNLHRLEEAEGYLDRAVEQSRQADDGYTEMCALQSDAAVKVMLHRPEEAAPMLRQAYAMATEAESADWQLRCITTMLATFDLLEQPDSSALYTTVGNALLEQLPPMSINAVGYLTARANHYCLTGQWAEAVADFEALMAHPTAAMRTATVFEHMARGYSHLGRWPEAYAYMDSARIQADSAASERLTAQMADFSVKYQTLEKDLEINRLHTQRLWMAVIAGVLLLVVAVAWLVVRQRRQRREAQMRISTLEGERRRIARELHDGLCNDLLALEMQLQFPAAAAAGDLQSPASEYGDLQSRLNAIRQRARDLSHQLMPPEFDQLTVSQLLRLYVQTLNSATTVTTSLQLPAADIALSPQASHELYRIVQEHTANIIKGGTATHIGITLAPATTPGVSTPGKTTSPGVSTPGKFRLTITDDGTPGDDSQQGLGHHTLRDRVTAIGGRCHTSVTEGKNVFVLEFGS